MSIVIFLIILAILILAHEFGHFVVAKKAGIRVDEFGIGFPPRLFGKRKGETIYSVNAIPFGGFVRIFGEDPNDEATNGPDSSRSFINKPRLTQAAVLGAGVVFNLFVGWILLSLSFMSNSPSFVDAIIETPHSSQNTIIMNVEENSPAMEAGLIKDDRVIGLESSADALADISPVSISNFIARHQNESINVKINRNEEIFNFTVTPRAGIVEDRQAIGILTGTQANALSAPQAFWEGLIVSYRLCGLFAVSLFAFLADAIKGSADFTQVTGPVGIVAFGSQAVNLGLNYILSFAAIISINLAVINLLPIPALDGGRLFFRLVEMIKRKPLNPKVVNAFNTVGFVFLILLMLAVTYNDLRIKLF